MKTFQDFCREKMALKEEGWDRFLNPMVLPTDPAKLGPSMDQKMRAAERLTHLHTPGVVHALMNNSPRFGEKCIQFQQFLQQASQMRPKDIDKLVWQLGA